jgi:hypothetical protein
MDSLEPVQNRPQDVKYFFRGWLCLTYILSSDEWRPDRNRALPLVVVTFRISTVMQNSLAIPDGDDARRRWIVPI